MAATPTDPFDWLGIQAALQLDPIVQVTAAQALPNQDPAAMLRAYKAMNGGALPPGMSPQDALLIEMGMASDAIAQNPALAQILQSLAATRVQQQADFAAAKQQVGNNYQQLTGDIENSGNAWMADIAQRMGLTAEQVAADPNLQGYGQTLTNIGNTADLNQATDQAWFDKMMTTYDQNIASQMAGYANGTIPLPGAELTGGSGGGGGGGGRGGGGGYRRGGRGRGYSRGGGGSGGGFDGTWKDPSTATSLDERAIETNVQYNPGFYEEALALAGGDPEAAEAISRVIATYGKAPRDVDAGLSKTELPNLEAAMEAFQAQNAQRQGYLSLVPTRIHTEPDSAYRELIESVKDRMRQEGQYIPSEVVDPTTGQPVDRPRDAQGFPISEIEQLRAHITPEEEAMAEALLKTKQLAKENRRYQADQDRQFERGDSSATIVESAINAAKNRVQGGYALQDYDEMIRKQAEGRLGDNFSYDNWEGHVEKPDRNQNAENQWLYDLFTQVTGKAREYDPNISMQETQRRMTDTASTKTTQKSTDPSDQLFDMNAVETLEAAQPATSYAPFSPFGSSRGITNLTEASQRILANRLKKIQKPDEPVPAPAPVSPTGVSNMPARPSSPPRVASTGRAPSRPIPGLAPDRQAQLDTAKTEALRKAAAARSTSRPSLNYLNKRAPKVTPKKSKTPTKSKSKAAKKVTDRLVVF